MKALLRVAFAGVLLLSALPEALAQSDPSDCEWGPRGRFIEYGSVVAERVGANCRYTVTAADFQELICVGNAAGGPLESPYPVPIITPAGGEDPCEDYTPPYTAWCRAGLAGNPTTTPSRLVASMASHTAVSLTWLDNSSYCKCDVCPSGLAWQGYTVERRSPGGGFAVITHVGAGATFVDRQVAAGKTYTYRVQADDGFGASPYTNEATVTVGAPTPPADVRTTVVSDARVDVSWTDASDDETQFEIERRAGSGAFQPLATIAANKTIFSDATVAASTAYAYRVRALNATGASPYATSPRVKPSAAPLFAPGAPCCLGAETQQSNAGPHVLLRWTDLVSNETGFRVERKESKADASWLLLAELPPSATLFADRTAVSGTLYVYRVVAYDAGGVSAGDEVVVRAP